MLRCLVSEAGNWVCQARGLELLLYHVVGNRIQVMGDREIVGAQECIWGCGRPVLGVGGEAEVGSACDCICGFVT